jgi:hypothetical protein
MNQLTLSSSRLAAFADIGRVCGILILAFFLPALQSYANSWAATRSPEVFLSRGTDYITRIDGNHAEMFCYDKSKHNYAPMVAFTISHMSMPQDMIVSKDGRYIAAIQRNMWWGRDGDVLQVYDASGRLLKGFRIEDIWTAKEIETYRKYDTRDVGFWLYEEGFIVKPSDALFLLCDEALPIWGKDRIRNYVLDLRSLKIESASLFGSEAAGLTLSIYDFDRKTGELLMRITNGSDKDVFIDPAGEGLAEPRFVYEIANAGGVKVKLVTEKYWRVLNYLGPIFDGSDSQKIVVRHKSNAEFRVHLKDLMDLEIKPDAYIGSQHSWFKKIDFSAPLWVKCSYVDEDWKPADPYMESNVYTIEPNGSDSK